MSIKKIKHCDGCDDQLQLEPILIGNIHSMNWIEVKANSSPYTKGNKIFKHNLHFHNEQCLIDFIDSKRSNK
jgi:hypothetical protein